jgi:hypothetical protein
VILVPGGPIPTIIPFCQRCDMPVERLRFDVITSPYHLGIHAACCGYESSTRITNEEVMRLLRTREKLYVIVRRGSDQGIRGRRPTLRSVSR